MEGLTNLKNLEKLFLNRNRIAKVEGLTGCHKLQEINVSHQNIGKKSLALDPDSMAVISRSLVVLEAENNNIQFPDYIEYLDGLVELNLKDNNIESIEVFFYIYSKSFRGRLALIFFFLPLYQVFERNYFKKI